MITHKEYLRRVYVKFGRTDLVVGRYAGSLIAIEHKCSKCDKLFKSKPSTVLRKKEPTCTKCSHLVTEDKQTVEALKFKELLHKKYDYIKVLYFTSKARRGKFKCKLCANVWETTPMRVLQSKIGCPVCGVWKHPGKGMLSADKIKERLREIEPRVRLVEPYRTEGKDPIWVQLKECRHKIQITTKQASGVDRIRCTVCKSGRYDSVKLGDRVVQVEGYERFALKYLVDRGVNPKRIKVERDCLVPRFAYQASGVYREYWPDILVGEKRIVEVKSTYTLNHNWKVNVAKAKAVEAAGFSYTMLVAVKRGARVLQLPKDWYRQSQEQIDTFIKRKLTTTVTVLSMDPGPVNFGWSVLKVDRDKGLRILGAGMIRSRLTSMVGSDVGEQLFDFTNELRSIIEEFEVDHLVAERFMSRGHGGNTIELVNVMLGAAVGITQEYKTLRIFSHTMLITAAQWKNAWNRHAVLEDFYKETGLTDHTTDAICLGAYAAQKWLSMEIFENIHSLQDEIIAQLSIMKG